MRHGTTVATIGCRGSPHQPFLTPRHTGRRVLIWGLAALLGMMNWTWASEASLHPMSETTVGDLTVNGVRFHLQCHGWGTQTIVIIEQREVALTVDQAARTELAHLVRLCMLTVSHLGTQSEAPAISNVLPALLLTAHAPAPYVIVSEASASPVLTWPAGSATGQAAGFVLLIPSPPPATGLVVQRDGATRPLPLEDRDALVLGILSLFWPPDE
jgi:hypothetical protein